MNQPDPARVAAEVEPALIEQGSRRIPFVWILPLVALLAGGWLLHKTMSEKGATIEIRFQTAEGIEEGKTRIKYREVSVGSVQRVRFAKDLSHVLVSAELVPGMENFLTDATRFWVVRPRIGTDQISGLGTLISGAYIAMDPSKDGKQARSFAGLEKPPVVTSDATGTRYRLRASQLGSLNIGSPIYFRQIKVGEITEYALADDHQHVDIGIFIRAPHDRFILNTTRFWNVGGVGMSVNAEGVRVEMESLVALLTGGVAFETPLRLSRATQAEPDTQFSLHESYAAAHELTITHRYPYILNFNDTVRGLQVGAPVEFRGLRAGTVTDIQARIDPDTREIVIPVLIELEPERILEQQSEPDLSEEEINRRHLEYVEELVKRGLRARLATANFVTGQLFVELDMFPDAQPASVRHTDTYPEIPSIPRPLSGITASVNRLLDRLEQAPVEQTLGHLDELIVSSRDLVNALEKETPLIGQDLRLTAEQARTMLQDATDTLAAFEAITTGESEMGIQMQETLDELRAAARSIRVMTEYLERHPEALIKGKHLDP